jgi:hypothetical protein
LLAGLLALITLNSCSANKRKISIKNTACTPIDLINMAYLLDSLCPLQAVLRTVCCSTLTAAALLTPLSALELHVSPAGSDQAAGTLDAPFQTLAQTRDHIRQSPALGKEPITVNVAAGTYYLGTTVRFTAADSGTAQAPVIWQGEPGQKVILSGARPLKLSWKASSSDQSGVYQAETPAGLNIDQLFINGELQHMARYPNYDPEIAVYNGFAADAFSPARAATWADPTGGYIHAIHAHHWGGYHYRITGKNKNHEVQYEGGWQNNRQMGMHKDHRFVENIFEELDAPGEWFHDSKNNILYYYPTAGIELKTASIEISLLSELIEFQGTQQSPVKHIQLKGLTFCHSKRTFMETKEPLLRSDWTIYRGGAVLFKGAEDCSISDCEFDQPGGNAVFVSHYNRRINLTGNHIHGAGASGICFVGSPDAVRNPLFEYNESQSLKDIDLTPGPKSDDYPADCKVDDCLIHSISTVEKQATGVQISMASRITIRHCSIYDIGRAGINISEGTFGGHTIEFCDVFDTVRETGDHGSFNSWGRDRFWNLKDCPDEKLPELSKLDTEKTIIRNSRWRCDHGWDVDLDDGSSHYEIYNNLMLKGGLKLREGFYRHVYNNITVNNTLHPHVWYKYCGDRVHHNIWMGRYRPARIKFWDNDVDHNFFTKETDQKAFTSNGWDTHSAYGDPQFIDPANGDYRVKDGSPALKAGFVNFPMDRFGVQKPALKALARTPELPHYQYRAADPAADKQATRRVTVKWLGAVMTLLEGEEFSAFGINEEDGGLHIKRLGKGSPLEIATLQVDDVIQSINGDPVKDLASLNKAISNLKKGQEVSIGYARLQKSQKLIFKHP